MARTLVTLGTQQRTKHTKHCPRRARSPVRTSQKHTVSNGTGKAQVVTGALEGEDGEAAGDGGGVSEGPP